MKLIFCIIALLVQPVFSWYAFHKHDKRKAALKMPMLYYSGVYLVIQMIVYSKICIKIPEDYQLLSYLIQAVILIAFIILEIALFGSNRYIEDVETKEQNSIRDFKELVTELEIYRVSVKETDSQKCIDNLLEEMRYSDPVSSSAVEQENNKIHELIAELSDITENELIEKKCEEIAKQLEIRKIKNTKECG